MMSLSAYSWIFYITLMMTNVTNESLSYAFLTFMNYLNVIELLNTLPSDPPLTLDEELRTSYPYYIFDLIPDLLILPFSA